MRYLSSTASVLLGILFLTTGAVPAYAQTTDFEVSGWIPYWRVAEGVRDARKHLDVLDEVNPFAFTVQSSGKLKDLANLSGSSWKRLFRDAANKGVLVIPTVMWSDTASIQTILSDPKKRAAHVKNIATMVSKGKYDGVDIDYEGKRAETKDHYSAFLKELKAALGTKTLVCTIEARTPPDSLYTVIPDPLRYANDFVEINKYCDRVKIMAYDQQRADIKLNSSRAGAPYYPVADIEWVQKVMTLTAKDISKDKLVLGIATYGRELELTVAPNWYKDYKQLWSLSENYAWDTTEDYDVTPSRNPGGEMSFSYIPKDSSLKLPSSAKAPAGTPSGDIIAARALAYANATGKTVKVNLVWWSDAGAIEQKIALAKELGLRGVALFKIDGGEDADLWKAF